MMIQQDPTKIPMVSASKMDVQPFVSIVIPTYNRKEVLKECLDTLFNQNYQKDRYEIIVVNDGSTDGTDKLFEEYTKKNSNLKFFTQENKGSYAARNVGTKNSIGEIICFTDDDCIVDEDWVKNLVGAYTDENVGGVGGTIVDYKTETIIKQYIKNRKLLNQEMFFSPVVGANMSYCKRTMQKAEFFDESFRNCEDVDFGIRVRLKGFKIKYTPNAIVYHKHRATLKGLIKQQYNYGKGNARLHKKYTKDFYPSYNLTLIPLKIIHRIITYPIRILKAPFVKDKKYYLAEPVLDIVVFTSHLLGILNETLLGKPYVGDKYNKKLEFIGEQSISKLIRMVWSKFTG